MLSMVGVLFASSCSLFTEGFELLAMKSQMGVVGACFKVSNFVLCTLLDVLF